MMENWDSVKSCIISLVQYDFITIFFHLFLQNVRQSH